MPVVLRVGRRTNHMEPLKPRGGTCTLVWVALCHRLRLLRYYACESNTVQPIGHSMQRDYEPAIVFNMHYSVLPLFSSCLICRYLCRKASWGLLLDAQAYTSMS